MEIPKLPPAQRDRQPPKPPPKRRPRPGASRTADDEDESRGGETSGPVGSQLDITA